MHLDEMRSGLIPSRCRFDRGAAMAGEHRHARTDRDTLMATDVMESADTCG